MSPDVETEDLILLRSLDRKFNEIREENLEMRKRLARIEYAQPGGRWGKIAERAVLAGLTAMLGWQNVSATRVNSSPVQGEVRLEAPKIDKLPVSTVSTSTVHR